MKCPHCGVEIEKKEDRWMCPQCFAPCTGDKCPACSAMRPPEEGSYSQQRTKMVYPDFLPRKKRRPLSIVAIVLSVLLILGMVSNIGIYLIDKYYISEEEIEREFNEFFGVEGNKNLAEGQTNSFYLPAQKGEAVRYGEYEYDLGGDLIWCKYDITLVETFRGEEALAMVGEDIDLGLKEDEELYIACFKIVMLDQHKVCDVLIHPSYFFAYESQIDSFPRVNLSASDEGKYAVSKGRSLTMYVAFAVTEGSDVVLGFQNYDMKSGAFFAE